MIGPEFNVLKQKIEDYELRSLIGKGSYGSAYLVVNRKTGEKVCSKVVNHADYIQLDMEMKGLTINHPTIIKYYGFSLNDFNGQKHLTIFMEYAVNNSLRSIYDKELHHMRPNEINATVLLKMFIGLSFGMKKLHENQIMHRDISPNNILFDENYEIRICDFGLSKNLPNGYSKNESNRLYGTPNYASPELLNGEEYSFKADVYSFGAIMKEVFDVYQDFDLMKYNIFKNLIERCTENDPNLRPTFKEICDQLNEFVNGKEIEKDNSFDLGDIINYIEKVDVDIQFTALTENNEGTSVLKWIGGGGTVGALCFFACKLLFPSAPPPPPDPSLDMAGWMMLSSAAYGMYKIGKKLVRYGLRSIRSF